MDEDAAPKTPVVPLHDLIDELSPFVPESTRQAFAEKLALRLGAVGLPRATVETTSMHSTAMVISAGMASNTEICSEKFFKPDPSSPVAPLSTIRPSLKDLVRHAVPRIAPAWYDVGLQLDLEPDVLDEIEKKSDQPRKMLAKWLQGSSCTWQSVLNAVEIIRGGKPMEDIREAVVESITGAQSTELSRKRRRSSTRSSDDIELSRKRRRSSTRSSDDPALQQSVAKKSLPDSMSIKMDLLARDISDLRSESDPKVIIKLLYGNALANISDLLEPHLKAVKKEAVRYYRLGLHHVAVGEDIIESADSIDSLMSRMSVGGMWEETRFLRKAIASIPHSAPERDITEAVLFHYGQHLAIYNRATLLKDAIPKEPESQDKANAPMESNKLVPLKITSPKAIDCFTCEDCYILQVQLLKKAYGIPEGKIICREVKDGHSTTVTFMIPRQYVRNVIQHSGQLDAVWILLELDIIEVSIPGVFTFIPSVGCFLSLLRGSRTFTADLLGVTEVLPYQMYCLLDSDIREPLSGRPLSVKKIEQHWDSHDEFPLSDAQSEDDATQAMLPEEEVIPPKGSNVGATDELQSKVGELEDKVKDLERKVTNLFMDNVALKTKLEASREVERQQQEEIARLKGQLVQALSAQDTATQEQSLSRTRESQLEEKIKVLEETRSDLEAEVEKLEKQLKQLEVLPSDMEKLAKSILQIRSAQKAVPRYKVEEEAREGSKGETGPSSDQKAVARYKVEEEARKGSKGETSAVPDQVTGGPTAATRGSQPPTQVVAASPVIVAAKSGRLSTLRKLLDGGAGTVEDQDEEGMNAMHWAAQAGHIEVIKFLLPLFGERVHEKTNTSSTMLHLSAQGGHCLVARYLIEEVHLNPQDRDKWGHTALLRAAYGGSVPLVKALLEDYGSSVDELTEEGMNAMHMAAEGGHIEVIKFLLPLFGERVHEKTNISSTMLHFAAQCGHCQVARYLIEEVQMDPQDRDKSGGTALLRAAWGGSVPLVKALLEDYGSSVDELTEIGLNALHLAAECGHLELVKFLIPILGEKKFAVTHDGDTCLTLAIKQQKEDVVKYLIQEGGFGRHH